MQVEYKHYPLKKRRERLVGRMKRWIEIELKKYGETNEKKLLKKRSDKEIEQLYEVLAENELAFNI